MTTPSPQELARHLAAYSAHVDTWHPDDIDTFLTLGYREWLETNKDRLDSAQANQLAAIDAKVLILLQADYGDEAKDEVTTLKFVADIIKGDADSSQAPRKKAA